jgi:hypothetical protein
MSLFLQTLVLRGILSSEQEHRQEEFHMKKILTQYGVFALAIALMVPLAQAQPAKFQAVSGEDAGTLSKNSPDSRKLWQASTTGSPARAFAPSATCST